MPSLALNHDRASDGVPTRASALACPVLVLNRNFQPINIVTVRKALVMMVSGTVEALDREYQAYTMLDWLEQLPENDDDVVGTPTRRVRAPRLVSAERLADVTMFGGGPPRALVQITPF